MAIRRNRYSFRGLFTTFIAPENENKANTCWRIACIVFIGLAVRSGCQTAGTTAHCNAPRGVKPHLEAMTSATHVATLDGVHGPFAMKYTEAFEWRETFADQTFTSTFDADNGPAAVAYSVAFRWGLSGAERRLVLQRQVRRRAREISANRCRHRRGVGTNGGVASCSTDPFRASISQLSL
jgi:hypothetical protein